MGKIKSSETPDNNNLFEPPLPQGKRCNLYLDTSVLRPLITQFGNQIGRTIWKEISKIKLKTWCCDHTIYEIKRGLLVPFWRFYFLLRRHKDIQLASANYGNIFSGREAKVALSIVTKLLANSSLKKGHRILMCQIKDIALEIERTLETAIEGTIPSKTGCKLHKPNFNLETNYPEQLSCKCECNVDVFWVSKKGLVERLANYDSSNTKGSEKKWYTENTKNLKAILGDPKFGKSSPNCKKMSDVIINLQAKKDMLILSSDRSFKAMEVALNNKVHILQLKALHGGSPSAVAEEEFLKTQNLH